MSSSHNRTRRAVQSVVAFLPNIIARCRASWNDGSCNVTANKLPDGVLLDIFELYLNDNNPHGLGNPKGWHTLVHVCGRWRDIVFASPRRLNLRLLCDRDTPARAMLDIWPALPIEIHDDWTRGCPMGLDNIIAALEHPDRVCSIELYEFPNPAWEGLAAAMQVPFPELTYLRLWSDVKSTPVLPDSFLGGSALLLRKLKLRGISLSALPNLLLSASDLLSLSLYGVPHSGYISPEAMVACLSSLNRLRTLSLGFQSPRSRPDQPSPPPQTRVILPALTDLFFGGMTDYLEDFLARIDTPVLNKFSMSFFPDPVFDVPHLKQFIGRAKGLKLSKVARVDFSTWFIRFCFTEPLSLSLEIMYDKINSEVNAMSLVCNQLSPFLSLVERLDLIAGYWPSKPQGEDDTVSSRFLEIFQSFTAIRRIHVSEGLTPFIVLSLRPLVGERATEVLPNLRDLFMEGSEIPGTVQEAMQPFFAARQLSGQPVVVRHWGGSTADR
ncbi:hypothetical protein BC826DRAFT_431726 [Russula brevipes]|nr:hypothetical protein BC826DRAFT_431726 [Russula brevipes]